MSSVNGGYPAGTTRVLQNASPASGVTVVVNDGQNNVLLWLTPAAAIAALTVQLPTDAGSFIGEEVQIGSSKTVTALTISGATTIFNSPSTLNPGDLLVMEKVAANTWTRQE